MQNENKEQGEKRALTAVMLLEVFKKNLIVISLVAVVFGMLSGVYTALFVKTKSEGTSR